MYVDKGNITLGGGVLYIDNVNVGALKGDVTFSGKLDKVAFQPNDATGDIKRFIIKEECSLSASFGEFSMAKVKMAMGSTTSVGSSQSFPAYDPSSFTTTAGSSYDVLTFGGNQCLDEVAVRFEHTRACGTKKIVIILYNATCNSDFSAMFGNTDIVSINDVVFTGLSDTTRSKGDQIGVIVDEVLQSS